MQCNISKKCKTCEEIKPLDEFYKHSGMKDGHLNACIPCRNLYVANWSKSNLEKRRKIAREYAARNAEHYSEKQKEWWAANPHKSMEYHYKREAALPGYSNAISANRRAQKKNATPIWANKEAIKILYAKAKRLTVWMEEKFHVDHIVPLVSDYVCGLHCEANLQILPKTANLSKCNRWWPDMPEYDTKIPSRG